MLAHSIPDTRSGRLALPAKQVVALKSPAQPESISHCISCASKLPIERRKQACALHATYAMRRGAVALCELEALGVIDEQLELLLEQSRVIGVVRREIELEETGVRSR